MAGGLGDDTFILNSHGSDILSELRIGGGIDTLDFTGAAQGITIDLRIDDGTPQAIDSSSDSISLFGVFESVLASPFNDVIFGNGENNTLSGESGDDILRGFGGNDVLSGGTLSGGVLSGRALCGLARARRALQSKAGNHNGRQDDEKFGAFQFSWLLGCLTNGSLTNDSLTNGPLTNGSLD
jgi:Ca2+-binding RTX toxin-like protein